MVSNYYAMVEAIAIAQPLNCSNDHNRGIQTTKLWFELREYGYSIAESLRWLQEELDFTDYNAELELLRW